MYLIGRQSERDDGALALETRERRKILNEFRTVDDSPWKLDQGEQIRRRAHPNAQLVCSSALYNCGGLVFGSRRVWIEPDEFRQILTDDGYQPVTQPFQPGDVVLYGKSLDDIDHVGFVHCVNRVMLPSRREPEVWVRSKWGPWGEYVHEIKDVPMLLGQPLETFRFRS